MATVVELPLRRDKTMIWDGVAKRRVQGVATLFDLTGCTIRLICRKKVGDVGDMFTLVSGAPTADGRIDIAANQVTDKGEYSVRIEAAATGDASEFPTNEPGYYPYEIEVTEGSGEKWVLAYGNFKYEADVR